MRKAKIVDTIGPATESLEGITTVSYTHLTLPTN